MRRIIAPRLASGECREPFGHGLPPGVKAGLRAIARRERQSMSWVLEQVIIDYFRLPKPDYREQRTITGSGDRLPRAGAAGHPRIALVEQRAKRAVRA